MVSYCLLLVVCPLFFGQNRGSDRAYPGKLSLRLPADASELRMREIYSNDSGKAVDNKGFKYENASSVIDAFSFRIVLHFAVRANE